MTGRLQGATLAEPQETAVGPTIMTNSPTARPVQFADDDDLRDEMQAMTEMIRADLVRLGLDTACHDTLLDALTAGDLDRAIPLYESLFAVRVTR